MVITRMKLAVRRILSWLLTGAGVLLVPQIAYWLCYGYLYLTALFAKMALVFSFISRRLGLAALLVMLLIYGIGILIIHGSEKLHPSVLGGHFLVAGLLSLCLVARNSFSCWLIFQEMGLHFQGAALFFTVIAQIIYTGLIFATFFQMGSLPLLLGNRKRIVFVDIPKDVHDPFSMFAYISDVGGLMADDGKPNRQIVNACLNRALQSGVLAKHSDCLICDAVLVRKNTVRLQDVIQVHQQEGQAFFNPDASFCELFRVETKNTLVFSTLQDARKL